MNRFLFLPILACVSAQVLAAPNGELLASHCYQCHGFQGRSLGGIDSIAGESAGELYNELKEFQTNGKKDIMSLQSRIYNDAELHAIANYLSTLPPANKED